MTLRAKRMAANYSTIWLVCFLGPDVRHSESHHSQHLHHLSVVSAERMTSWTLRARRTTATYSAT